MRRIMLRLWQPKPSLRSLEKCWREQRNVRGISQEALALSADVDRTFVSQMERGIRQPTLTTLCKLSEALEIQPSTLVARVEKLLRLRAGPRAPSAPVPVLGLLSYERG